METNSLRLDVCSRRSKYSANDRELHTMGSSRWIAMGTTVLMGAIEYSRVTRAQPERHQRARQKPSRCRDSRWPVMNQQAVVLCGGMRGRLLFREQLVGFEGEPPVVRTIAHTCYRRLADIRLRRRLRCRTINSPAITTSANAPSTDAISMPIGKSCDSYRNDTACAPAGTSTPVRAEIHPGDACRCAIDVGPPVRMVRLAHDKPAIDVGIDQKISAR